MHETSVFGMWNTLERIYQTKSLLNVIYFKSSKGAMQSGERAKKRRTQER